MADAAPTQQANVAPPAQPGAAPAEGGEGPFKVFCQNLPPLEDDVIATIFRDAARGTSGEMVSCHVRCRNTYNGQQRFAFVAFSTVDARQAALGLDGRQLSQFGGPVRVRIDLDENGERPPHARRGGGGNPGSGHPEVFVDNLPAVDDAFVKDFFVNQAVGGDVSALADCNVRSRYTPPPSTVMTPQGTIAPPVPNSGASPRYAFIGFTSDQAMRAALSLDGAEIAPGWRIKVSDARIKPSRSQQHFQNGGGHFHHHHHHHNHFGGRRGGRGGRGGFGAPGAPGDDRYQQQLGGAPGGGPWDYNGPAGGAPHQHHAQPPMLMTSSPVYSTGH